MRVEETDLKVHGDGRPGPFLLIVGRQQLDLSADLRFLHPGHAFDPADMKCLVWFSLKCSNTTVAEV